MNSKPFTSSEVAERLGVTVKTFYRMRHRYHAIDRMPRPISEAGKPTWERAGMEAWLTRNDPRLPQVRAANDALPPPMPSNDVQWSEFLRRHYAGQPAE
jgi:hypothetical protein